MSRHNFKKFSNVTLFKSICVVIWILLAICGCKSKSVDENQANATPQTNNAVEDKNTENDNPTAGTEQNKQDYYKVTDNIIKKSFECKINKGNICVNTEAHYPSFGLPAIDKKIYDYIASKTKAHNLESEYENYFEEEKESGGSPESITPFSVNISYTITYNAADGIYIVFRDHDDSNAMLNGRDMDGGIDILMLNPLDGSDIAPESIVNLDDEAVLKKLAEKCTEALKKDLANNDNVDPNSIKVIPDKKYFKLIVRITGGLSVYFYLGDVSNWYFTNVYVDIPW